MKSYIGNFGTYYAENSSKISDEEQKANVTYIYKVMLSYGWTVNAICGILGNMQNESSINPGRWQSGVVKDSKGYGLVQWTPSTNFRSWASSNGYDELMDGQLARIKWEHDNGKQFFAVKDPSKANYNDGLNYNITFKQFAISTQSAYALGRIFGRCYERSGAILSGGSAAEKSLNARGEKASAWYKFLTGANDSIETIPVEETKEENVNMSKTISAKDLIAEFYKMLGWKYEWGAARTGVVDCSGAFTYAFKKLGSWMYHGSNTMYKKYSYDNGKLGTVELLPGMAVYKWRSPNDYHHVGLYIGSGLVIEAKGSKYGVVVSRVEDWHYAGKLKSKDGTIVHYDVKEFTPQSFVGTVNTSGTLNMRSATETVSSNLIKKLSSGSTVDVLDIEVDSGWYAIKDNGTLGFVMQKYINKSNESLPDNDVEDDDENNTPDSEDNSGKDIRTVISKKVPLNVRTGPATSYEDIGDLIYGATVVVLEEKGTWVRIKWEDGSAWCSSKYLKKLR